MCLGPIFGGSGGPVGLGSRSRLAGQFQVCSAAFTGDMEDPFGSMFSDLVLAVCSVM